MIDQNANIKTNVIPARPKVLVRGRETMSFPRRRESIKWIPSRAGNV